MKAELMEKSLRETFVHQQNKRHAKWGQRHSLLRIVSSFRPGNSECLGEMWINIFLQSLERDESRKWTAAQTGKKEVHRKAGQNEGLAKLKSGFFFKYLNGFWRLWVLKELQSVHGALTNRLRWLQGWKEVLGEVGGWAHYKAFKRPLGPSVSCRRESATRQRLAVRVTHIIRTLKGDMRGMASSKCLKHDKMFFANFHWVHFARLRH